MLYDLECPECGKVTECELSMDGIDTIASCSCCHGPMTRRENRIYSNDNIMIHGDTVSGGCSYNYYDDSLGMQITSKQHRKDEMKKQGLVEYSPNPELKKHRDEARYIRANSTQGDRSAAKAINKELKSADNKRRKANLDRVTKKATTK